MQTKPAPTLSMAVLLTLAACEEPVSPPAGETGDTSTSGDGDGDPTTGDGDGDGDPELGEARTMFVTASKYAADFDGVAGADARCRQAAMAITGDAQAAASYKAWIGSEVQSASERLDHWEQRYVRPDGSQIAAGWDNLVDGQLDVRINVDEYGNQVSGTTLVWTGTAVDGGFAGHDCANWTSTDAAEVADVGSVDDDGPSWTAFGETSCDQKLRLYCIEQGPSSCGDGIVDEGEQCDDQNLDEADGCLSDCSVPRSCYEILALSPSAPTGQYLIAPYDPQSSVEVTCDMDLDGGGWTGIRADQTCDDGGFMRTITTIEPALLFEDFGEPGDCRPVVLDDAANHAYTLDLEFPPGIEQFYLDGWQISTPPNSDACELSLSFVQSDWDIPHSGGSTGDVSFGSADDPGPVTSYAALLTMNYSCKECELLFPADKQPFSFAQPSTTFRLAWGEAGGYNEGWIPWAAGMVYLREAGPSECGDGVVEGLEQCDDQNDDETDGCTTLCAPPACDDGIVSGDETDLDCGGSCSGCAGGLACNLDSDCYGGLCNAGLCGEVAASLRAGYLHTCVLMEAGAARCWGNALWGQLGYGNTEAIGDNETAANAGPIDVGGVVENLVPGGFHTCALLASGAVRCWGHNLYGQLGYGHTDFIGDDEPLTQADVNVGGFVTQLALNSGHTCALLEGGELACWGRNSSGELGYGHTNFIGDDEEPAVAGPVDVGGLVTQVAVGRYHTCVLLEGGAVRCWGWGALGRLGYGNTDNIGDNETPAAGAVDLNLGGAAVQIAAGDHHTCALLANQDLLCWGDGADGQLGYGNVDPVGDDETPADVGPIMLGNFVVERVVTGMQHTCVLSDTGDVRCWGLGTNGRLGYGNTDNIGDDETPDSVGLVELGGPALELVAGLQHTCALLDAGQIRCWGAGVNGQLGYGDTNGIGDDPNEMPPANVPYL